MNLNQINYLPGVILVALVFLGVMIFFEKRFFSFIKTYWFYRRSKISLISSFFIATGLIGLLVSILDFRGPEEKIKTAAPSERTIILVDTSASMLAEDVKPSRLQKAALIAKHFARKAAGHQLSVIAFAEIQKKIVPFTNDLDLIDSRLDSLKNLRNQYGSSALSVALQESVQYFKEGGGEPAGNILVLTDGEETAESVDLKIPPTIHVAFVGIGTEQGGRIPLDDSRNFRYGYKKDKGVDVVTKLNESFFKDVVKQIPSSQYWLANTYSLPSEEILDFFGKEMKKSDQEQDMVIKPVLMEYIVLPSLLLLVIGYGLKFFKVFALALILIYVPGIRAAEEEKKIELSPEIQNQLEILKSGGLNRLERLKLASELQVAGAKDEAHSLYKENLSDEIEKEIPAEAYLNYGNSFLEKEDVNQALSVYEKLDSKLDNSEHSNELRDMMDKNISSYFVQQEEKKKEQEKKEQEKKEQDKKKGENKDRSNNESGEQDSNQQQNGQENQKKDDPEENKDEEKKENEGQDEKESDKKDGEEKDKQKDMKGQEDQKKAPPKKLPAKLKQLMSDDRQLQMRMIENGTKDLNKRKSRKSKDW